MPTAPESIQGPRLAFVLRKLPGTVLVNKMIPPATKAQREKNPELKDETQNTMRQVVEPAGFMIFTPTGYCYRISESDLRKMQVRGMPLEPDIIGYEQANKQDTPVGRYKLARSEQAREKAYKEMEDQVIFACTKGSKDFRGFISNYDPNGKMPEKEAA